jgi:hypothetical protein
LGQIGDARAVEPLVNALKTNERIVRQAAAIALRKLYLSGGISEQDRLLILSHAAEMAKPHRDTPGSHEDSMYHKPYLRGNGYTLVEAHGTHTDKTISHTDTSGIGVPLSETKEKSDGSGIISL